MTELYWLSPGDPAQQTGGYLYNQRMVHELRQLGWAVRVLALPGRWPLLPERGCAALLATIPDRSRVVADGLCWTGLGPAGSALAERCAVAVLLHSPLFREDGDPGLRRAERAALEGTLPVATSPRTLADLGVEGELIRPGVDRGSLPRQPVAGELLCVGTLTPRKAHDVLFAALGELRALRWELHCAGAWRDPEALARLRGQLDRLGLADRVHLHGPLDRRRLEERYATASLLVQPARYEAWGMALAEALVRGVPVLSTPAGVLDELPADAWSAVPPADPHALATAIAALLTDPEACSALGARGGRAAGHLPDWTGAARRLEALL